MSLCTATRYALLQERAKSACRGKKGQDKFHLRFSLLSALNYAVDISRVPFKSRLFPGVKSKEELWALVVIIELYFSREDENFFIRLYPYFFGRPRRIDRPRVRTASEIWLNEIVVLPCKVHTRTTSGWRWVRCLRRVNITVKIGYASYARAGNTMNTRGSNKNARARSFVAYTFTNIVTRLLSDNIE